MKRLASFSVMILALGVSACGLRGDLERPDPLWGEPKPEQSEAETEVQPEAQLRPRTATTQVATTSYRDPSTGRTVWVQNEGGGDKPLASPTTPISEGGLPPAQPQ